MTKVNQYPVQAREAVVEIAKDVFRTVDYLTTRPDVDVDHIVFIGQSIGAVIGAKLLAAEPRLSAGVLLGGGYGAKETNAVTSHIMQPMLMINGAHDHIFPYAEAQKPMFDDLGSEVKEHVVLNANHNPDPRDVFEVVDSWLRKLPRTGQLAR